MPRALRALLTLVVAGVLGVAGAASASASATGASTIAPFTYTEPSGVVRSVPRGCVLIHSIVGDGRDLTQQTANVDCAGVAAMRGGLFCDVTVVFTFRGDDGTSTSKEASTTGCRTLGVRVYNPGMPVVVGADGIYCARLVVGDRTRSTSCHVVG